MGIFEIILFLIIALIVIPPDDLPQVMRAVGKVMRELRLASNTVMREISGAIGDEPFNILPPRFDDPHPPAPPATPMPPAPAFLAPEPQPQPPAETVPPTEAVAPPATAEASPIDSHVTAELPAQHRSTAELHLPAEHEVPGPSATSSLISFVPELEARPPTASMSPAETAPAPPASGSAPAAEPRTGGQQPHVVTEQAVMAQATSTEPPPSVRAQPPARQRRPRSPRQPKVPKAAVPPDDNQ
ncbi:MAG TPA: twin-arginine translocase TatA/TatE family subunit [Candidatus Binataceae bacterium]|nr:twin-arginine translocase TatA/TatE family subunit [Candidatus Binataceae bacterium]